MRWAGHVARMGRERERGTYRVLVGKPVQRDHLEVPGVDGREILRRISGSGIGHRLD